VGQLAIQWVLEHPAITSVIVGARRPEQAAMNIVDEPDGNVRADVEEALKQ
jgi:aryl-alcohol dehydrogenase-like predicted oxidoreductase